MVLLSVSLLATAQKAAVGSSRTLRPNVTVESSVPVQSDADGATTFQLDVPQDAFRLELVIENAPADLDLEISLDYLEEYRSESYMYNERLVLSRTTDPYLETGTATIKVLYQFDVPPVVDGTQLNKIPFSLTAYTTSVEDDVKRISLGGSTSGTLLPETGMVDVYRVRVPRSADALRVDLSNTDGDLDVFVFRSLLNADPFLADYSSQTFRSTESLVINEESFPPLGSGTHYIMVLDQVSADAPADYELYVSLDERAPAALLPLPEIDVPASPFHRALLATVEVVTGDGGGSGCIVSEDGYVITNWHVVEALDGSPADDITIGLSLDHSRPPVELFRAEVVDYAPERDLALLKITEGRYGQSLPPELIFPAHEFSEREIDIATPLQFIGYPWIGGTGSRASVTYTRGTASGFQRTSFGLLLKSDGEINPGNSGGAAVDNRYRLVGFPSSVVFQDAGQLAYVVPVDAIPASWRRRIGR
jgi:hypothetical protein